jgi:hypothetical protein
MRQLKVESVGQVVMRLPVAVAKKLSPVEKPVSSCKVKACTDLCFDYVIKCMRPFVMTGF